MRTQCNRHRQGRISITAEAQTRARQDHPVSTHLEAVTALLCWMLKYCPCLVRFRWPVDENPVALCEGDELCFLLLSSERRYAYETCKAYHVRMQVTSPLVASVMGTFGQAVTQDDVSIHS